MAASKSGLNIVFPGPYGAGGSSDSAAPSRGGAKTSTPIDRPIPERGALMSHLFSEFRLRDVAYANRIGVSPMCQYSCEDGFANDWHFAHLAARAVGGGGPRLHRGGGGHARRADFAAGSRRVERKTLRAARADRELHQGARRRARRSARPRRAEREHLSPVVRARAACPRRRAAGGRSPRAPLRSARDTRPRRNSAPRAFTRCSQAFATAAKRAYAAGFRTIEVHAAHGYLIHQFLSPFSNRRADAYGGSFDNRTRFLRDCVPPCGAPCPIPVRCSSAFPRPTGPTAAGTSSNRSSFPAG